MFFCKFRKECDKLEQYLNDECRNICRKLAGREWEELFHETLLTLHDKREVRCDVCYFSKAAYTTWLRMLKAKWVVVSEFWEVHEWDDNKELRYLDDQIERQGVDERSMMITEVVNRYCELGSMHKVAKDMGISVGVVHKYVGNFIKKAKQNYG